MHLLTGIFVKSYYQLSENLVNFLNSEQLEPRVLSNDIKKNILF